MIRTQVKENEKSAHHLISIPYLSTFDNLPNASWKRATDLIILTAAHLVLLPFLILLWTIVPLAIWLEDRGPVFYVQRRVGKGGRIFNLYKFRSMIRDAESVTGPVWASENDPRITRVGKILRLTALDELPQLINVWKGDLTLVGPRPERPELIDRFAQDIPDFVQRLQVRPGLTGLAQVYGRYSSRPREKLHYDKLYIKKMSLWLDMKLLCLSAFVTVRGKWQSQDKLNRRCSSDGLANSERPHRQKALHR